jgi:hypothetical protein
LRMFWPDFLPISYFSSLLLIRSDLDVWKRICFRIRSSENWYFLVKSGSGHKWIVPNSTPEFFSYRSATLFIELSKQHKIFFFLIFNEKLL